MRRILVASPDAEFARVISERLPDVDMAEASDVERALVELEQDDWSLIVLDDRLGRASREVLNRLRSDASVGATPVVHCVSATLNSGSMRSLVEAIGIRRLLFHPVSTNELVHSVAAALGLTDVRAPKLVSQEPPDRAFRSAAAVAAIWDQSRSQFIERIGDLDRAALSLLGGNLSDEDRHTAMREAHRLGGTLGTFGFPAGSDIALEIERMLADTGTPDALRLSELVVKLRDVVSKSAQADGQVQREQADAEVLFVTPDADLHQRVELEGTARGFAPLIVQDIAEAERLSRVHTFAGAFVDFRVGRDEALAFLEMLASRQPPVPSVVVASGDGLADRIEAVRRGAYAVLTPPVSEAVVVEAVTMLLRPRSDVRVLAVDDDPVVLQTLGSLLRTGGIDTATLEDPLRFWDVLQAVEPDLILLDVDMPHVSGVELCRAARTDPRYRAIPIVFLTVYGDAATIERVFAAGADDFVVKPVVGPELIARINNRLERASATRRAARTDSLTGLPTRELALSSVDSLLARCIRDHRPAAVAVISPTDIDVVNERYGHAAGDALLRRVARLLVSRFQQDGVVARWAGATFLVAMAGVDADEAADRVRDALNAFSREIAVPAQPEAKASFGGGVASLPADGSDTFTLLQTAGALLARTKGRGPQVVQSSDHRSQPDSRVDVVLVEDDELLVELLRHAFAARGYSTSWFADGRSALHALQGPDPDVVARVVLLDVDLPGIGGLELLRVLAPTGFLDTTRVVMLTGRAGEPEVLQALELGAFDHVAKPFSVPILMQRVRRALQS